MGRGRHRGSRRRFVYGYRARTRRPYVERRETALGGLLALLMVLVGIRRGGEA